MGTHSYNALFGRDTDRTRRALGLATAIFLSMFLIATYARGRWMQNFMGATIQPVVVVILVGGGLTIWNAYWNDGLFVGWLFTFCLITPWLLQYNLSYGSFDPFVSIGFGALALAVSTVGYLIGVGMKGESLDDSPGRESVRSAAVVGPDPSGTTRWGLLLGALFLVPAGLAYGAGTYRSLLLPIVYPVNLFYPIGAFTGGDLLGVAILLSWILVATWPAYRGNGVLVSCSVVFAPIFGMSLSYSLIDSFLFHDLTASVGNNIYVTGLMSFVTAVILGSLGFVIGVVLRRGVASQPSAH